MIATLKPIEFVSGMGVSPRTSRTGSDEARLRLLLCMTTLKPAALSFTSERHTQPQSSGGLLAVSSQTNFTLPRPRHSCTGQGGGTGSSSLGDRWNFTRTGLGAFLSAWIGSRYSRRLPRAGTTSARTEPKDTPSSAAWPLSPEGVATNRTTMRKPCTSSRASPRGPSENVTK